MQSSVFKHHTSLLLCSLYLLISLIFAACQGSTVSDTPSDTNTTPITPDPTSSTIYVPKDYTKIQTAIDNASDGDTIIIESGIYNENLVVSNKRLTIASNYYTSNDSNDILTTIIDGNRIAVITIDTSAAGTSIIGLTIQNGEDGIFSTAKVNILNNIIKGNIDGIDYEGGGGVCKYNLITQNTDDALDLDQAVEVTVEANELIDNSDDGIEIRLHPYTGDTLLINILNNKIAGNREDGIQLIGYDVLTDRKFTIQNNLIVDNAMAAIGMMSSANTVEDYSGASLPEEVTIFNNTFSGNNYGITGGANSLIVNNIFTSITNTALKNVMTDSLIYNNLYWGNGLNFDNTNGDDNIQAYDPMLKADYTLNVDSPAIDSGVSTINWKAQIITITDKYNGAAPDLGFAEY